MKKTLLALTAALLTGSAAFAQIHKMERRDTAATARTYNLNPVVVTGSGHHQRLKSTATPVHVLSSQELREQGITTFEAALQRMMPQVSLAPNSMGTFLRLNGLGNKYILILINGQKLSGDISNNIELSRISMSRVKRIEVLDGAASSLYGSDAIAGVINIITDQPTSSLVSLTSDTRASGHGQLTESINLDINQGHLGSYTTYTRDQADSYQTYTDEYVKGSDTEAQPTISPLYTGYRADLLGQHFTYTPSRQLALNAGVDYSYKLTDRPDTRPDVQGGTDYEMRYKGLRWNLGAIYKFSPRHSLQADFTTDRLRYGRLYDVETKSNHVGDYVQSKKQRTVEGQLKAILATGPHSTTILGADWRRDYLTATSGSIDQNAQTLAAYGQHELRQSLASGTLTATAGLRLTHHETFGQHLTPKLTLMYSQGPVNLRATYSAGFRAPGLDELYYHYFSVNRGQPQIIFGNRDLRPEKSHYLSLNAEYRSRLLALSLTAYVNQINNIIVKNYEYLIPNSQQSETAAANSQTSNVNSQLSALRQEFPEMTDEQAEKLERYSRYQNSDRGLVEGLQLNLSANLAPGFNLTANYACTYARTKADDGQWTALERSIRNAATLAANYHHAWGRYALNVCLSGRLQSKTYYTAYENAPGYGLWSLHTTHTIDCLRALLLEPSLGVDNLFDRVDSRTNSSTRRYALYTPGRMLVVGLKVRFKQ